MKRSLAILFTLAIMFSCTDAKKPTGSQTLSSKIPGLMPVDVYLNMEKQGFKTTKTFSAEYGNLWESKYDDNEINYSVSTFSKDTSSVESVKATATLVNMNKSILASKQFFIFVSSVPYEGSNPNQIGKWIEDNFNMDKATMTISKVKFTIYVPTKSARILTIERAE